MSTPEIDIVISWHDAVNAGDSDRVMALSRDDVVVGGPRGTGSGSHLLHEWVARAGIHLEPGRVFHRAGTVVVEERARWRSADDGPMTEPQDVASVFLVREGVVASVIRFPDLATALDAGGLAESDELRRGG